ncbi:MAG: S1 family peptidase, partial [Terriglobales bacterium]
MPAFDSTTTHQTAQTDAPAQHADWFNAAGVALEGTVTWFIDSAAHVFQPKSAMTLGLGAATGYGLRTMQLYEGLQPVGWMIGAAMTYSFAVDMLPNLSDSWNAFTDVAHHPENEAKDRKVFEKSLGAFAFDGALFGAGSAVGGKMANSALIGEGKPFVRIPTLRDEAPLRSNAVYRQTDPLVDLYNNGSRSVVSIRRVYDTATGGKELSSAIGTGVLATADGDILTNAHVANSLNEVLAAQTSNGDSYLLKPHVFDYENDLAVLKPVYDWPGGKTYPVARFAETDPAVGEPVAAIGYPMNSSWRARYLSPGKYTGTDSYLQLLRQPLDPQLPYKQNVVSASTLPGTEFP